MSFKFRLQTVFDLRQHEENEQKDALARARQKLEELAAEEKKLRDEFAFWSRRYLNSASEGMSPLEAVRIGHYLDDLSLKILQVAKATEQQNTVVEQERLLLVNKMKERKTLETLHDKQLERFTYDLSRKQEQEIEELISSRR